MKLSPLPLNSEVSFHSKFITFLMAMDSAQWKLSSTGPLICVISSSTYTGSDSINCLHRARFWLGHLEQLSEIWSYDLSESRANLLDCLFAFLLVGFTSSQTRTFLIQWTLLYRPKLLNMNDKNPSILLQVF